MFPSLQSTLTDTMVAAGDPELRFPFSVTFLLSITGSRRVRIGAPATMPGGPPGVPGADIFSVEGSTGGITGCTTEILVVFVLFCPSDCWAVIERV
jgi:hypothetical protein